MREKIARQRLLLPGFAEHRRSKQLVDISDILDAKPEILDLVQRDLVGSVRADLGRRGLTAEQVLRILVLQRVTGFSFDELEFAVNDSGTYWTFCRLGVQQRLRRSRIHANVHKVRPETIEAINRIVVKGAIDEKVETLERARTDATVTETNIHPPTDSSLLWDTVRVLGRVMEKAAAGFATTAADRRREAKRAYVAVATSANNEEREPHYRKLVELAEAVMADAKRVAAELRVSKKHKKRAAKLAKKLDGVVELGGRVAYQTKRRVFEEKKVPSPRKVVSIFEPHTDVIVKDRHDVHYGHKVTLTTGESGLVLDCVVEKGNPADVTLAVRSINRLKAACLRLPGSVPVAHQRISDPG
jgi:IS5 family transposase